MVGIRSFPFGKPYFQGLSYVSFREDILFSAHINSTAQLPSLGRDIESWSNHNHLRNKWTEHASIYGNHWEPTFPSLSRDISPIFLGAYNNKSNNLDKKTSQNASGIARGSWWGSWNLLICHNYPSIDLNNLANRFGKTWILCYQKKKWEIITPQKSALNLGPVKCESFFTQSCKNLDVSPKHAGHNGHGWLWFQSPPIWKIWVYKFKIQKDLVEILGVGNSPLVT